MICKKCGAAIPDYASFCNICGEPQTATVEELYPPVIGQMYDAPVIPVVEKMVIEAPAEESVIPEVAPESSEPKSPVTPEGATVTPMPASSEDVLPAPEASAPTTNAPVQIQSPLYAQTFSNKVSGSAITSLVLGVMTLTLLISSCFFNGFIVFLPALVGFIMGLCSRKKDTTGIAKAGIILNLISFILSAIVVAITVALLSYVGANMLRNDNILEYFFDLLQRIINSGML